MTTQLIDDDISGICTVSNWLSPGAPLSYAGGLSYSEWNQSLPKINNSIALPTAQIFYFGVLGSITLEKRKLLMTKQLPNGFRVWMA